MIIMLLINSSRILIFLDYYFYFLGFQADPEIFSSLPLSILSNLVVSDEFWAPSEYQRFFFFLFLSLFALLPSLS